MTVAQWLKNPGDTFKYGDALCELNLDGRLDTVRYEDDEPLCGVYWHNVDRGAEVGPDGSLFEYGTSVPETFRGVLIPRHINARREVYHRHSAQAV